MRFKPDPALRVRRNRHQRPQHAENKITWNVSSTGPTALLLPITIPHPRSEPLSQGGFSEGALKIEQLESSSSLGQWSAAGSINFEPKTHRQILALSGSFSLSDEGVKEVGPFPALNQPGQADFRPPPLNSR